MGLAVCVAQVDGCLGESKDYQQVCAMISGELQNGWKFWEALGLVWGPLNWGVGLGRGKDRKDSRKRRLGIPSELKCSQYRLQLQLRGKGVPRTTLLLCRTVLCGLVLQRADAMGSWSVTEAVWQN